jgi:hypothetical protein
MPFAYPVQLVNSCLSMLSRRALLGLGAVLLTSPINARPRRRYEYEDDEWLYDDPAQTPGTGFYDDWYIGEIPDRPFPVPVVDPARIDPRWRQQTVSYAGPERPGTIVINPRERFLYLVQPNRMAQRYGIGVEAPKVSRPYPTTPRLCRLLST